MLDVKAELQPLSRATVAPNTMVKLEEEFHNLRVIVEATVGKRPVVIAVTSTARRDGKSYIACGLGRAFADAGYRSVVVDANVANPAISTQLGISKLRPVVDPAHVETLAEGAGPNLWALAIAPTDARRAISADALESTLDEIRAVYDVVVVDCAALAESNLALQFARAADGVLIAARLGRQTGDQDVETMAALGRVNAHVLGIVATEKLRVHAVRQPATSSANLPVIVRKSLPQRLFSWL